MKQMILSCSPTAGSGLSWSSFSPGLGPVLVFLRSWTRACPGLPSVLDSGLSWSSSSPGLGPVLVFLRSWTLSCCRPCCRLPLHLFIISLFSLTNFLFARSFTVPGTFENEDVAPDFITLISSDEIKRAEYEDYLEPR